MIRKHGELLRLTIAVLLCGACSSTGTTRLCADFYSYQTVQEIRTRLREQGVEEKWREKSEGSKPGDQRPAYDFIRMSGPYRVNGIDGLLRLTVYNGRLMEAHFEPQNEQQFLNSVRSLYGRAPAKSGEEVVIERRTRFRMDAGPDGRLTFTWYDPKLDEEWKKWVRANS
jgi:hypothetical protein